MIEATPTYWVLRNWKILVMGILVAGLIALNLRNSYLKESLQLTQAKLEISSNNEIAYKAGMVTWEDRYGQEHAKTIMFNENLTSFKSSQDSVTKKLVSIIKDQGIALNKLQSASLLQTKISTVLTKEIKT